MADPDVQNRLKKLIEEFTKSEEVDDVCIKNIKNICKQKDEYVEITGDLILELVEKKHAVIRLRCVQLVDVLFQRSHVFRNIILRNLETLLKLTLGHDPTFPPLPPPQSQQKNLQRSIIKALQEWTNKYGSAYKKLQLAFSALKDTVDFNDLCLVTDPERLRKKEKEERMNKIWKEKVEKITAEMEEYQEAIMDCLNQTNSLFAMISNSQNTDGSNNKDLSAYSEELAGQYNILVKRLVPKSEGWVSSLTRAGSVCSSSLMTRALVARDGLQRALKRIEELGIQLVENSEAEGEKETSSKSENSREIFDPTTFAATVKKVTGEDLKLRMDFNDDKKSVQSPEVDIFSQPGCSKTEFTPKIRLEDVREPTRMVVDPEKSRFWVSDNREGEIVQVGKPQRVAEFVGKEEEITWVCGAPLGDGKLCPRQDRKRCPFHGLIVKRDDEGRLLEGRGTQAEISRPTKKAVKKSIKRKGLKSAVKWDETSRTRIEKKIFNKSSLRRVNEDLVKYNKIRTRDKFVDQFNY